ncbi:tetratricopeptide (TPR) repeat protein [Kibdelosporangium banguiense]|uniref:Tetratricopeptide (TPR) repeat protein n=1 Tax=Kibdelosporangium banguiense TaxID=1365924 RepID=A0ABS4U4E1_9PSEU|nr:tetratricopeptide repeat protein [Kibdelosporangium banguiense]MBP2331074.1 tetratricopeptide (TPR) repeat protein [Kibdelosporangium banguiense]
MNDVATVLDGLSLTDWSAVDHAYGPATDVPQLIHDLVSDDATVRAIARSELCGNLIHHGARFSATPKVIPYLIELATAPGVPDRAMILRYLTTLLAGPFTVRDGFWIGAGSQGGPAQQAIATACHDVAVPGIPALLNLATGRSCRVRVAAICVLGCFQVERSTIIPTLEAQAANETADAARAAAVFALGLLTKGTPRFEETLRSLHEEDPAKLVRTTAAIKLALHGFGDSAVVQTLIEALDDADLGRAYADLPWGGEKLPGDVGHALAHVQPEWGAHALSALGRALHNADGAIDHDPAALVQVIGLARAIARLIFPYGAINPLLPSQRKAVELLVQARSPWVVSNVTELLAQCGLPETRDANATLVGVEIEDTPSVADKVNAAAVLMDSGNFEAALTALEALPDDNLYVLANRGNTLFRLDRTDEAITLLELATERFPDFETGWNLLACALHKAGRDPEALEAIDNAIQCNSSNGSYFYSRAVFLASIGATEEVFPAAHEMIDRAPDFLSHLESEQALARIITDPRWEAIRLAAFDA